MSGRILAGDVGGTKTNLALYERRDGKLHALAEDSVHNQGKSGLEPLVRTFLAAQSHLKLDRVPVEHACFGIAGPVKNQRCEATNLPWTVDAAELRRHLKISSLSLVNDLEATGWGICELDASELVVLQPGALDAEGSRAVVAAGTGLGEAGMLWDGTRHHPFPTEGGHSDFAPRNKLEIELLLYLTGQFGRVSYERLLSGPGLFNIYKFLKDTGRGEELPEVAKEISSGDPAAVISASTQQSALCQRAVSLFVSVYGAEAGNMALKTLALGGVYLGGGIAPKNIEQMKHPDFLSAFNQKGRMQPLLEGIPVKVIMNDRTALLGAAHCAEFTH